MIARALLIVFLAASTALANGPTDGKYGAPRDLLYTNRIDNGSFPFNALADRPYYGANTGTDSQGDPTDWASLFLFAWLFEEADGTTRTNSGTFGSGGDLTVVCATPPCIDVRDDTGCPFGKCADFTEANDEWLECTQANCGGPSGMDRPVDAASGWSWGCTGNKEKNATSAMMYYGGSSTTEGWQINYDTITDRAQCATFNTSQTTDSTGTSSWVTGTTGTTSTEFYHNVGCRLDGGGGIEIIFDGVPSGSPGTAATPADRTADFHIGQNSTIKDWDGAISECWATEGALHDEAFCQIGSCGLVMAQTAVCSCDGTAWVTTGYNNQTCVSTLCDVSGASCATNADCYTMNACTLPTVCNAAPASEP